MLKEDYIVAIIVLIASTVLFLDPSWDTVQFVVTMIVLFCAMLWLKEILEK